MSTVSTQSWNSVSTLLSEVLSSSKLKKAEQDAIMNKWNSKQTEVSHYLTADKKSRGGSTKKKVKDPNAPVRNKSGYMLFCDDHRGDVRKKVEKQTEVTKLLGEMWNKLSESEKDVYKQRASKDKERYTNEMSSYHPSEEVPEEKKTKKAKESGPKRPTSAFFFFTQEQRPVLKQSNPELSGSEISSKLGEMWRGMTDEEKKPFQAKYEVDHERYVFEKNASETAKTTKKVEKVVEPVKATKKVESVKATTKKVEKVVEPVKTTKKVEKPESKSKSTPGQQLFNDERRDDVVTDSAHRGWTAKQVNEELVRMWKGLTNSEREAYEQEAEQEQLDD